MMKVCLFFLISLLCLLQKVNAQVPVSVVDNFNITCKAAATLQPLLNDVSNFAMVLKKVIPINNKGSFTIGGNNLLYQPDTCFNGVDTLQYVVCLASNTNACDTNFIYITISGCQCIVPVADFDLQATTICQYQTQTFLDKSTNNPTQWKWMFDGAETDSSSLQNPTIRYNQAGEFSVHLTASNQFGSSTKTTKTNIVKVLRALPQILIDTVYATPNTLVQLNVFYPDALSYQWTPVLALSDPNIYNPIYEYNGGIVYLSYVISFDSFSVCKSPARVVIMPSVTVPNGSIFVPNVITPNNDGLNDVWLTQSTKVVKYNAIIFNRWGQCVFASTDMQQPWNGTTKGVDFGGATYFYRIDVQYANGETQQLKGDITVIP
jgi:gliding motility-associated-like protein